MRKLSTGFVLLLTALALQFALTSQGVHANISFAALIAFAFIFGFWELAALIATATLLLNWQPALSPEILIYALYPIAVYFFRGAVPWYSWAVAPAAIILGFAGFYLVAAPSLIQFAGSFMVDLLISLLVSGLIFFPLKRFGR